MSLSKGTFAGLLLCACTGEVSSIATDSGLPVIDAGLPANQPPVARFVVGRTGDAASRTFDASGSHDPDGTLVDYRWDFGDGSQGSGLTSMHAYSVAGCVTVTLTVVDERGATANATEQLAIAQGDAGTLQFTLDPLPRDGALVPRDVSTNRGTVTVSGKVISPGWEDVRVRLLRDGGTESEQRVHICDGAFTLDVPITAELVARDLTVSAVAGDTEAPMGLARDLVAGDVFLVQGQSNAVAALMSGSANGDQSPFLRSFGNHTPTATDSLADDAWHRAEGDAATGPGAIGQWALRMASLLASEQKVPVAVLNGALGGQPIEFFARDDANHENSATNYGLLLERTHRAGLAGAVRGIFFYQGESDVDRTAAHVAGFTALHAAWRQDYPNVERVYVVQVRAGCSSSSLELRDAQRRFAQTLPITTVMSTNGLDGHDGCHYAYPGYQELGERFARLVGRDLFGATPVPDTQAVDVTGASVSGDTITVVTHSDASALTVDTGVAANFIAPGRTIMAVRAVDLNLEIDLVPGGTPPTSIGYDGHPGDGPWITNANHIGLFSFTLPIQ